MRSSLRLLAAVALPLALTCTAASAREGVVAAVSDRARAHGVPVALALAVAHVESGLRCQARGRAGELGPMQIKPATARGLGYAGPTSALNSCGAGLDWGVRHLAVAYRRCGSAAGAATLHNRGLGAACRPSAYSHKVTRVMAGGFRPSRQRAAPLPEARPDTFFQQWWLNR
jgi:soluble lytic murein transglycosylase-like protein